MFIFPTFAAEHTESSGDRRLTLDLIGKIANALNVSPTENMISPQIVEADRFEDAFFINVKPSKFNQVILDKRRSLSIAIRNDLGALDTSVCDVILNPVFNPFTEGQKKGKMVFNFTALPSRVYPGSIKAAAEENMKATKKRKLPNKGRVITIVIRSLSSDIYLKLRQSISFIQSGYSDATFLVTTSPRTTHSDSKDLKRLFKDCNNAHVYGWKGEDDKSNPYLRMLGLADVMVVGDDTLSSVSDCVATGKPVYLLAGQEVRVKYLDHLYNGGNTPNTHLSILHAQLMKEDRLRLLDPVSMFDPWEPTYIDEWGPIVNGIVDEVFRRIESNPALSGKFSRPAALTAPVRI